MKNSADAPMECAFLVPALFAAVGTANIAAAAFKVKGFTSYLFTRGCIPTISSSRTYVRKLLILSFYVVRDTMM